MAVEILPVIADDDLAEASWKTYYECFAPLAVLAAQRHLMTREEFAQTLADPRIDKVLTYGEDRDLVGIATFTRDLEAVPLLSGPFFERCWPRLYAERRIWYIPFVGVTERARKSPAFVEAFAHYFEAADAENGIVGLDICTHNELAHKLPQIIGLQVRRLSGGRSQYKRICSQHYWVYDMQGGKL